MRLKPGVSLVGLRSEMVWAMDRVEEVFRLMGAETVVTSGTEAEAPHAPGSRHWTGMALDFSLRGLHEGHWEPLEQAVKEALGADFRVKVERGGTAPHLHVSLKPRWEGRG